MPPEKPDRRRVHQVKLSFNAEEIALLRDAADLIDLVPYYRAVMLEHAGKKKGLAKSRLRGNPLTTSGSASVSEPSRKTGGVGE